MRKHLGILSLLGAFGIAAQVNALSNPISASPEGHGRKRSYRHRAARVGRKVKGCHNFAGGSWPIRPVTTTAFETKKTRRQARHATPITPSQAG